MAISFKKKITVILHLLQEPKILSALLSQFESGYLVDVGWFNSFRTKKSVNKEMQPIPWLTYPCIDFLESRNLSNLHIFEYGAGASTLYFAKRAKKVVSLEHNLNWFNELKNSLPDNAEIHYRPLEQNEKYITFPTELSMKFDIVLIDAELRPECLAISPSILSENGVIILDDSERPEYKSSIQSLIASGFKTLDFWGIAPIVLFKRSTTVFYHTNNCLGI